MASKFAFGYFESDEFKGDSFSTVKRVLATKISLPLQWTITKFKERLRFLSVDVDI